MQFSATPTVQKLTTPSYPDMDEQGQVVVVQNLGPGTVFVDFLEDLTIDTGIQISPWGAYEFPRSRNQSLYIVATEDTDVRVVVVG